MHPTTSFVLATALALSPSCLHEDRIHADGDEAPGATSGPTSGQTGGASSRPTSRPSGALPPDAQPPGAQPSAPAEPGQPAQQAAEQAAEPEGPTGAGDPGGGAAAPDHAAFDAILGRFVREQKVAYLDLRQEGHVQLERYLDAMSTVDVAALPRNEALAYYINLYNASMIRAVLQRLGDGSWRPDADEFAVFKAEEIRTRAGLISLDHLEHEIIRPTFGEPRIHVALVCGAASCPPLVDFAYTGENLEATLEANMKRFVADPVRNPIDHAGRRLRLSQIFNWFKDDFGGEQGVKAYVDRYTERDVSNYSVEFVEYDWALNIIR